MKLLFEKWHRYTAMCTYKAIVLSCSNLTQCRYSCISGCLSCSVYKKPGMSTSSRCLNKCDAATISSGVSLHLLFCINPWNLYPCKDPYIQCSWDALLGCLLVGSLPLAFDMVLLYVCIESRNDLLKEMRR